VTQPPRAPRPIRPPPSARTVAAEVLARVAADGAFAAAVLDAELARSAQLEPRDRALATEIVYGALRVAPWLEGHIAKHTPRGIAKLDGATRSHLVVAAYQLFFLARVPAFAAVDAAVDGVRFARGEKLAGFTNAVLRKVAREAESGDDAARAARHHDAIVSSAPKWLETALVRALGQDDATRFLESTLEPPPVSLRVNDASARDVWVERLRAESSAASVEPGRVSPHAILVRGGGNPQSLAGVGEKAWAVQEEGSQLVALAVGARAGDRILDACAGRGNKAAILARAVGAAGAVDAADLHPQKLTRLVTEMARAGEKPRATHAVDWTVGDGGIEELYDRVLVDAPCSGVGTLRRRPEILARRKDGDLGSIAKTQLAIATRAVDRVRPGGRFIYAVCSVLREEAEDVVGALLEARSDLRPVPFDSDPARAIAGDATSLRLLPNREGTDGYFVASFVRSG
jgi:16S rRNA (cytosine967-C5)-methyltransferase